MRLPWINREHHDDVVRAQQDLILYLKGRISALENRVPEPVAVTVKLPDDLAMVSPALLRRRIPAGTSAPAPVKAPKPEAINWANVNVEDPVELAKIAADELGFVPTPYVLSQTIQRIKTHAQRERVSKLFKTQEKGKVGTINPPESPVGSDYLPAHIKEMIETAEKG